MRAIVCADKDWGIGKDGELLVRISSDLKRFKEITMGCPVVLGRKTLATFPKGKPLPGRENLILSRNPDFEVDGATVCETLEQVLERVTPDAFVIGGGDVYRQFMPYCKEIYVTRLETAEFADTWFDNLDADPEWERVERDGPQEEQGYTFWYDLYRRR